MEFTKQEIKQQIRNLKYALKMVDAIPKRNWVVDLRTWAETCENPEDVRRPVGDREGACDTASEEALVAHTCGSAACFGGWVAVDPYFQAQGVQRNPNDGSPEYRDSLGVVHAFPRTVAEKLFGNRDMFSVRGNGPCDFECEDKLVKNRIKWVLKQREAALHALEETNGV